MKEYSIGSDVWFTFKGTVCSGQVIAVDGNRYTVSFVYNPGDGRAPESVIYTITEKYMLQ